LALLWELDSECATLSSTVLAFADYATLRPVNRFLAQLAMIFSLEDSFLALIVRMCGFVRMHLYVSAGDLDKPVSCQFGIPEHHALFQYIYFAPMGLADVATGFYLTLFAVKSEAPGGQPGQRSTIMVSQRIVITKFSNWIAQLIARMLRFLDNCPSR
jgi:hypothetical protein